MTERIQHFQGDPNAHVEKPERKVMTAQEHLANTRAVLERGTVKRNKEYGPLNAAQIERRKIEVERLESRIKNGRGRAPR